jgi:hypothetical protein
MSENINPVDSASSSSSTTDPQKTTPTATSSTPTMDTKIATTQELQAKAPKVWRAMLEGIASSIMGQMQRSTERLVEMIRKMKSDY